MTEDNELVLIPKFLNEGEISHAVLTRGQSVLAAGEANIVGSEGNYSRRFNNWQRAVTKSRLLGLAKRSSL